MPRQVVQSVLARTLNLAPILANPLGQVGVLADYAEWKHERLPSKGRPLFAYREKLWEAILPTLLTHGALTVLEFGVAWGYATKWWTSRLDAPRLAWHGFDTFTGLPTAWDRAGLTMYDAGSFSADGNTPPIDDARLQWHVGDVAESIGGLDWPELRSRPLFLLFDFDLYAPTTVALEAALPHLRPGDVLYFDEAQDAWNERRVIDEMLLPNFTVQCLGSTATALALAIARRNDQR